MTKEFQKADNGKYRPSLEPIYAREEVIKVLTYGATKYDDANWMNCDDWSRYSDAADRHEIARKKGEDIDPESGLHHLAHQIASLLFLLEKDLNPEIKDKE